MTDAQWLGFRLVRPAKLPTAEEMYRVLEQRRGRGSVLTRDGCSCRQVTGTMAGALALSHSPAARRAGSTAVRQPSPLRSGRAPHGHARPDHALCARRDEAQAPRSAPHSTASRDLDRDPLRLQARQRAEPHHHDGRRHAGEGQRRSVPRARARRRNWPRRPAAPSMSRRARSSASGARRGRRTRCPTPPRCAKRPAAAATASFTSTPRQRTRDARHAGMALDVGAIGKGLRRERGARGA